MTPSVRPSISLADVRSLLGLTLGWLTFVLLCFFQGSGINVFLFFCALLTLLAALTANGTRKPLDALLEVPLASALATVALVALVVSFQFSLSKDSSFIPALVVALAPLGFLLARGMGENRHRLYRVIGLTTFLFALVSCWLLISRGELAHLPLRDPNNYASLMYLVALPWVHAYLVRCWRRQHLAWYLHLSIGVVLFVVFMALFAAQSKAATVIVLVALGSWLAIALARRLPVRPVLLVAVSAVAALLISQWLYVVFYEQIAGRSDTFTGGLGIRASLIGAAFGMYSEYPITGIGMYVFPLLYRHYRTPGDQATAGLLVHNDYLQFLAEGGLLLVGVLLVFVVAVAWRGARWLRAGVESKEFSDLGFVLALGAVLAHAAVNFVFYSPVLAFLVGVTAAMPGWSRESRSRVKIRGGGYRYALAGGLLFGWLCWLHLGLDTMTYGILTNQPGVPFAEKFRRSPEVMLDFARTAQTLNPNRGVPVLAEAVLLRGFLEDNPTSKFLEEEALGAYRRAIRVDPWNPNAVMQMFLFVEARPGVRSQLTSEESPEALLLRSISIDPLYVPGIDVFVNRLLASGRGDVARRLLQTRVLPNIEYLARTDKDAALRYLTWLMDHARARGDGARARELEQLREQLAAFRSAGRRRHY